MLGTLLASYFFIAFCASRAFLGGWGFPLRVLVPSLVATVVLGVFVFWLAPLADLPDMWYLHRRPAHRAARGLCPQCGHALPPGGCGSSRCPECGGTGETRPPWLLSWPTFRRFLLIEGIALLVGCAAGMVWLRLDEAAFVREQARFRGVYERPRAWPADFASLQFTEESGFGSTAILEEAAFTNQPPRR